jgi:hypothetical protein
MVPILNVWLPNRFFYLNLIVHVCYCVDFYWVHLMFAFFEMNTVKKLYKLFLKVMKELNLHKKNNAKLS